MAPKGLRAAGAGEGRRGDGGRPKTCENAWKTLENGVGRMNIEVNSVISRHGKGIDAGKFAKRLWRKGFRSSVGSLPSM